jgi:hypothetical protein
MNDHAYDITHLLEAESIDAVALSSRVTKAAPPAKAPTLALVQDTMAKELLAAAAVHDELIQQYLRISGVSQSDWDR